ncbi:hydantoinase/oxoprolinase family protein [Archaeoglobus veneficus]|uniref:H4MPT-linked C1 transfer pathway protein n=1 Tax=Archaeoglobus veneficus (strain DSM 11195 / SNP6) TaxID=693661 RepID=F2KRU2_ARCVS|nr:hydantoinase/oxoprolinase family protein [Archaeoglobus veneficus]AEA47956.1 H4MPT-linked C1 transfer pathway protein [Archaeoglobus veneficus SNP6]
MSSLGLDVGGANLKFSLVEGKGEKGGMGGIIYFPIWKNADRLANRLAELNDTLEPEKVGVVITAELSDVFSSKSEGVKFVESSVLKAFPDSEVYFLSVDGVLSREANPPSDFAASNWVASVLFLAKTFEDFLFADMGSTTTDLIPVKGKILAAKTDYERLKRGELIYMGVLRTPVFHVLPHFTVPLVPEFFAITGDVFVVTGDIAADDYTCETPDGRGKEVKNCMQRLARQLCCDLEEIGEDFVTELAAEAKKAIIEKIANAMSGLASIHGLNTVVGCGIGEFILQHAAKTAGLDYISLREMYGERSHYFPAYAMARLVEEFEP